MDLENILNTIQPFLAMFVALLVAFLTAIWISAVIWAFRDMRARTRDVFAQVLATLMVFLFFPLFPVPGIILYIILRPRETLSQIYERTLEEEALLQGIEERMACPGCNRRIEEDFIVCPSCHTRLKKRCVNCGRHLHLRWNICPFCAAPQTKVAPVQVEPVILPAGERGESAMLVSAPPTSLPEPEQVLEKEQVPEGDYQDETPTLTDLAGIDAEERAGALPEPEAEAELEQDPDHEERSGAELDAVVDPVPEADGEIPDDVELPPQYTVEEEVAESAAGEAGTRPGAEPKDESDIFGESEDTTEARDEPEATESQDAEG